MPEKNESQSPADLLPLMFPRANKEPQVFPLADVQGDVRRKNYEMRILLQPKDKSTFSIVSHKDIETSNMKLQMQTLGRRYAQDIATVHVARATRVLDGLTPLQETDEMNIKKLNAFRTLKLLEILRDERLVDAISEQALAVFNQAFIQEYNQQVKAYMEVIWGMFETIPLMNLADTIRNPFRYLPNEPFPFKGSPEGNAADWSMVNEEIIKRERDSIATTKRFWDPRPNAAARYLQAKYLAASDVLFQMGHIAQNTPIPLPDTLENIVLAMEPSAKPDTREWLLYAPLARVYLSQYKKLAAYYNDLIALTNLQPIGLTCLLAKQDFMQALEVAVDKPIPKIELSKERQAELLSSLELFLRSEQRMTYSATEIDDFLQQYLKQYNDQVEQHNLALQAELLCIDGQMNPLNDMAQYAHLQLENDSLYNGYGKSLEQKVATQAQTYCYDLLQLNFGGKLDKILARLGRPISQPGGALLTQFGSSSAQIVPRVEREEVKPQRP